MKKQEKELKIKGKNIRKDRMGRVKSSYGRIKII